jgi:hypothetical protein
MVRAFRTPSVPRGSMALHSADEVRHARGLERLLSREGERSRVTSTVVASGLERPTSQHMHEACARGLRSQLAQRIAHASMKR